MTYNILPVFPDYPVIAGFTARGLTASEIRAGMQKELALKGESVVWLGLEHTVNIKVLGSTSDAKVEDDGQLCYDFTDGAVTDRKDIRLTVTSGDCMPIYMYDRVKHVIGLGHAGWRGLLAGMPAELAYAMQKNFGCLPEDIDAYIGPGIGACCFEVHDDVLNLFLDKYPWAEEFAYEKGNGKYMLDLKGIGLEILQLCGIKKSAASDYCSCCRPDMFYSYRRCADKKRMLAYIQLK